MPQEVNPLKPHLGYSVIPLTKRVIYFVYGPDGFTETFNEHTVDVLCRMGLIELVSEDNPDNGDKYHYKTFKPTGRLVDY
jgi:hypothetical protein